MELARTIANNAPISLRLTKEVFHIAPQVFLEDAQRFCYRCWDYVENTDDTTEGPKAFLQKRKPQWTGR